MQIVIDIPEKVHNRLRSFLGHGYALRNEDVKIIAEAIYSGQTNTTSTLNALGTISRQAAIDAPEKLIKDCNPEHFVGHQKFIEFMDNAEIGSFGNWQFTNGFNMGLTAAEVEIKNLPSAQPELPACGYCPFAKCIMDGRPCSMKGVERVERLNKQTDGDGRYFQTAYI